MPALRSCNHDLFALRGGRYKIDTSVKKVKGAAELKRLFFIRCSLNMPPAVQKSPYYRPSDTA
jgi:hypothetical protein